MTPGLREQVIAVASSQVGVRELGGRNRGPDVDRYLASVGLTPGFSWCAAFVYWCFVQAVGKLRIPNPCPRTGHALSFWTKAHPRSIVLVNDPDAGERIRPGCIFVEDHEPESPAPLQEHHGHCGILEGVDFVAGVRISIDGNTDASGGREGDGVYRKTRMLSDPRLLGFVDLEAARELIT